TNKDALDFKRPKLTSGPSDPSTIKMSRDTLVSLMADSDPYRVAPIYSYHDARTLPDRWVVTLPSDPLVLPSDPLMPSVADIAKKNFS
ncbi:hypothetical protein HAX54_002881, partial [Datura stramonium]|nr:hypothetical protein [Datura stramonium]